MSDAALSASAFAALEHIRAGDWDTDRHHEVMRSCCSVCGVHVTPHHGGGCMLR